MKRHYTGMSENIAGLIENILALKATVKEVYQSGSAGGASSSSAGGASPGSSNDTAFDLSRRAYIRRMLQVRRSTALFQVRDCVLLYASELYQSIQRSSLSILLKRKLYFITLHSLCETTFEGVRMPIRVVVRGLGHQLWLRSPLWS